jgi:hypothetical protein
MGREFFWSFFPLYGIIGDFSRTHHIPEGVSRFWTEFTLLLWKQELD